MTLTIKIDHRDIAILPLPLGYDDTAAGLYESDQSRILIDPSLSAQEQARILLHEVLHAIWDVRHLPNSVTEEQACGLLDGPLATFIRDNCDLMKTLNLALNHALQIV